MKKFLAGIAAAAIITVPMTSFALEAMSKGDLKKSTAQAGVSIAVDNVVIAQTLPTTIYWDTDGWKQALTYTGADADTMSAFGLDYAGVAISHETRAGAETMKIVEIQAIDTALYANNAYANNVIKLKYGANVGIMDDRADIVAADDDATKVNFATSFNNGAVTTLAKNDVLIDSAVSKIAPLTIDVGTCSSLSTGVTYNKYVMADHSYNSTSATPQLTFIGGMLANKKLMTGVVIGLPTVEINTYFEKGAVKKIKVVAETATFEDPANLYNNKTTTLTTGYDNEIIAIEKRGTQKMAILGGRVEISSH